MSGHSGATPSSVSSAGSPVVRLERVHVMLEGRWVLHNITWALHRGEHWAVLGPNGAGKSTFLRLVRGEIWPAPNSGKREYAFDGKPTRSPIGATQRMALVSAEQQQRYLRLARRHGDDFGARMTTAQLVFTGLLGTEVITRTPTPSEWAAVLRALEQVGIVHLADAPFDRLSQGQLRRALIARAIIRQPDVLLLDEIGVGLDARTRHALLDVLQQLAAQGTQLVITTHRPHEIPAAVNRTLELREGRIARIGTHVVPPPRTRSPQREAWQPLDDAARDSQPFVIKLTNVGAAPDSGEPLVLHDLTWRINAGEHWLLVGDNGVGKSTLLRLILGEIAPARGTIERFNGAPLRNVWAIKQRIGYVSCEFQARYAVDLTAEQVIASGFFASVGWLQPLTRAQRQRVHAVIEQLGLQALARRSLLAMSYGQARKVLLARALVNQPQLLILDEALDGLDASTRAELAALLTALAQHTTLLMVSHHAEDVLPCITHRAVLAEGQIVAQAQRAKPHTLIQQHL